MRFLGADRRADRSAALALLATLVLVAALLAPRFLPAQESATGPIDEAALLGPPQGPPLSGSTLDARTLELASRMRCPVCQGLSIADSPSASAVAMVSQVRELLAKGYTERQILDYFVRAYGEFVLLQPTAEGYNLVVWLAPLAAVLLGAALIAWRLRAARRRRAAIAAPGGASSGDEEELEAYLERVRAEVGP